MHVIVPLVRNDYSLLGPEVRSIMGVQSYEIERKNLYRAPNEGSCNIMSVASFFIGEWWSDLHMLAGHWVACLFWDLNRLTDEETDGRTDGPV